MPLPGAESPLAESRRRAVFAALVNAQDRGIAVPLSRWLVAGRFDITEGQVVRIEREGLDHNWPPLYA